MRDKSLQDRIEKFEEIYYELRKRLLLQKNFPRGGWSDNHCLTCHGGSNLNALHNLQDLVEEQSWVSVEEFVDTTTDGLGKPFYLDKRGSLRLDHGTLCFNVRYPLSAFRRLLLPEKDKGWQDEWLEKKKIEREERSRWA